MECILSPHLIPRHVTISLSSGQTIGTRTSVVGGAICPLAPSFPSLPDIRIARIRLFSSTPLLLRSSILTIREKNARVHLWQEPIWHYRAHMSTESAREGKSNAILPYRKTKKSIYALFGS